MAQPYLFWLLSFSLFYLLATSIILLRNRFELTPLFSKSSDKSPPKISVCIPARNEEKNVGLLLDSLILQKYNNYDVHVLDDGSDDLTPKILASFRMEYPGLIHVYSGKEKPASWLGKPWACHQLSEVCDGDILLFLDADTKLQPGALRGIADSFEHYRLDMLTAWPQQTLGTFWEKTVIPLVYYSLVTLLPAIYVYRDPRWMPASLRNFFTPLFAAACGQCIAFTRNAYERIGGHTSVKNNVVEDVELARHAKKAGLILRMFNGADFVSCRMYRNQKEMFEGLRKNFLAGFNHSVPFFLISSIIHFVVFILPFATLLYLIFIPDATLFFLSVSSIAVLMLHRLILAVWFRWDPVYAFTHPIGIFWFLGLAGVNLADRFTGRKSKWKGREV